LFYFLEHRENHKSTFIHPEEMLAFLPLIVAYYSLVPTVEIPAKYYSFCFLKDREEISFYFVLRLGQEILEMNVAKLRQKLTQCSSQRRDLA
jgi:hypothetical protein